MKSYLIALDSIAPVARNNRELAEYAERHAGMRSQIIEFAKEQGIELTVSPATSQAFLTVEMNPSDVNIVSSFPSVKEILPSDSFADELL